MLNTLAQNLTIIRKQKSLLQKDVAKAVGITATALSAYEKGQREPTLSVIYKLAEYYDISMDRLCGRECAVTLPSQPLRSEVLRFISQLHEEMLYYPSVSDTRLEIETSIRKPIEDDRSQVGFFDEESEPDAAVYCVNLKFASMLPWMFDYINDLTKLLDIQHDNGLSVDIVSPWRKEVLAGMKDTPLYTFAWEHPLSDEAEKKEE